MQLVLQNMEVCCA